MTPPPIPGIKYLSLLTESSSGATWKALQISLHREVDIRLFAHDIDAAQREHTLKIARRISRLTHPNIAQVFDIINDATVTCILQEHISGATLAELVAGAGPLKSSQALRLTRQLAEGLSYIWENAHLVIRNLKPQNLRTNAQGHLKISEYNLAVEIREGTDPVALDGGHIVGTPHFIAPEQASGSSKLDFRTDMYTCGAVLYFLVTGRSPFEGLDNYEILQQQVSGQIAHPRSLNDQLPPGVGQILTRMMMKDPAARYATWQALISDIDSVVAGKALANPPVSHSGSTIAAPPAGVATPARRKVIRRTKTAAANSAIPQRPTLKQKIAGIIRSLLWLLLLVWFAWLTNLRLDNPLKLPEKLLFDFELPRLASLWLQRSDDTSDTTEPDATANGDLITFARDSLSDNDKPADTILPWQDDEAAAQPQDTATDEGDEPPPPATHTTTATPAAPAWLPDFARQLREESLSAAITQLQQVVQNSNDPQLAAFIKELQQLPDPTTLVAAGLHQQLGREITISYMGRQRQIIPSAIEGHELHAAFLAPDGSSRPITLPLERLPAAERLRLLPPARSASDHAIHAITALQAGDTDQFNLHAPQTGPLAPFLTALDSARLTKRGP